MKTSSALDCSIISGISRVGASLCIPFFAITAHAAVCTYNGAWDTEPSSAEDDIVIVSGDLEWKSPLPETVGSWTQSGGTVTFATVYPGKGSFNLFTVTGNASVQGGSWTHKANSNSETYRINVAVRFQSRESTTTTGIPVPAAASGSLADACRAVVQLRLTEVLRLPDIGVRADVSRSI